MTHDFKPLTGMAMAAGLCLALAGCDPAPPGAPRGPLVRAFDTEHIARRNQVDLFVKSNYPALMVDINAQGGPTLTRAFDVAAVPEYRRQALALQLWADRAVHAQSPGALALAIGLQGG